MPLDIRLPMKPGEKWPPKFLVQLNYDGYYCFMCPFFERLREKSGQLLDLYGDATFDGESLGDLKATITAIRREVLAKPDRWEVHTGDSIGSYMHPTPPLPIFKTVERGAFLNLLDRLDEVVDAASRLGVPVEAVGD